MALLFEYEKDIQTGEQPYISAEPDSTLYNYFVDNEMAKDRNAFAPLGQYDDVQFENEDRSLTTKAVSKIGIKNFPGIGGLGFYKDAYSDDSRIVAPIHAERRLYAAPRLVSATLVDKQVHIVITPPASLKYLCYRIVFRQGFFALEHITYKPDCLVDVPSFKGDYRVYVIGYDEDNGTVSEESNELTLTIVDGANSWIPESPDISDISDIKNRVEAIEEEIKNYPDDEIHIAIAEVISNPDPEAVIEEV